MTEQSVDSNILYVLSIEDNPGDIRLIEEAIGAVDDDIQLRQYSNGQKAIEALTGDDDSSQQPAELIFVDLNLPGASGLDILRQIREDPRYDDIPVVVVSSSENPEDVQRAYDASANAYLTKPVDPDEFIETITAAAQFWLPITGARN